MQKKKTIFCLNILIQPYYLGLGHHLKADSKCNEAKENKNE